MKTRRQFFGSLFRSVATAAAMCYTPSVLKTPEIMGPDAADVVWADPGEWVPYHEWTKQVKP